MVTRNIVRQVLKILDAEGVQARCGHRLRRRNYSNKGPNYLWHIDGYDKLKPFGFCVHGAIDIYSRKILCLDVSSSNNDPGIITKYSIYGRKYVCVLQIFGTFKQRRRRRQGRRLRPRPHVYGYFRIRNFFVADTATVHTYTANSTANP